MLLMIKKKAKDLGYLRFFVYALLIFVAMLFIVSLVNGTKTVWDTALTALKISADSDQGKKCADGEALYGIHNYPFSSNPTEKGAHEKYTSKMSEETFRCSSICGPSDTTKFTLELLPKLTVGGEKLNVVANKAEFDALIAKQSGKGGIIDRTMILDNSLQRRNLGCFGPSKDYNNLQGASLTKQNTTFDDQKKAEAEREKTAEEEKQKTTEYQGTASGGDDLSKQKLKAPAAGNDKKKISDLPDGQEAAGNDKKKISDLPDGQETEKTSGGPTSGQDLTGKILSGNKPIEDNKTTQDTSTPQQLDTFIVRNTPGFGISKSGYWSLADTFATRGKVCVALFDKQKKIVYLKGTTIKDKGQYNVIDINTNAGKLTDTDSIMLYAYDPGKENAGSEVTKYYLRVATIGEITKEKYVSVQNSQATVNFTPALKKYNKGDYGKYSDFILKTCQLYGSENLLQSPFNRSWVNFF